MQVKLTVPIHSHLSKAVLQEPFDIFGKYCLFSYLLLPGEDNAALFHSYLTLRERQHRFITILPHCQVDAFEGSVSSRHQTSIP